MKEIWKDIKGFEGLYQISNLGRVKSFYFGKERFLRASLDKDGYPLVKLALNGKQISFRVSRLVALYFIPNPKNLPEVNHLDTIKINNCAGNLEWTTRQGNIDHAYKMGYNQNGENNPANKLKAEEVLQIRKLRATHKLTELAEMFNIKFQTVSDICRYKIWNHI